MRLLHLSDLHIGPNQASRTVYSISQSRLLRRASWKLFEAAQGIAGHSDVVCLALFDAVETLKAEAPDGFLPVITGDLTAYGHDDQFVEAREILEGRWSHGGVEDNGLAFGGEEWKHQAIPGNHDHWSGRLFPVGPRRRQFNRTFHDLPRVQTTALDLGAGWSLRLLRVDTDHEITWLDRFRARGGCPQQVREIQRKLSRCPDDPKEIRALLLHVPYTPGHEAPDKEPLVLDDDTRRAIESLCQAHRIHVFLTGHIHEPAVTPLTALSRIPCFQARAGSCVQHLLPSHPEQPYPPVSTFMVHDLTASQDALEWKTTLYRYSQGSFGPVDDTSDFRLGRLVIPPTIFHR